MDLSALETTRLVLEPWSERDRDGFVALAADRGVMRFIGSGETWEPERAEVVFEAMLEHWRHHGFGWRSVVEKAGGRWLGFVGLNYVRAEAIEVSAGEVEIGWWLSPSAWGRGIATEGALALRDEAFERIGLARIIGRYQPSNVASGRIMERIGMQLERDALGRHNETVRIYALGSERWQQLRSARA